MGNEKTRQLLIKIAAITVIVSGIFLALVIFTINNEPSKFLLKTILIAYSAIFYGLLGAMSFSTFSKRSTQQLAITSVAICGAAFLLSVIAVLTEVESQFYGKLLFTLSITSIALAQINMLYKINIVNKYAAISRIIAVVSISIFSFMIITLIWGNLAELQYKFMGGGITAVRGYLALLAIDISFTAATPLLNKMDEGKYEQENVEEEFLKDVEHTDTVPVE